MTVLYLTVFLSVSLAVLFMVFFVLDQRNPDSGSPEHDALLPFSDEKNAPTEVNELPETPSRNPQDNP